MLWVSGNEYLITKLHVIRNIMEARFLYLAASTVTEDNAHTKDVLYSNSLNEVYIYLKENGFEQYWSNFDSNGYDNIEQLTKMSPDELDEVFDDVKMLKKGHRKRLKALLAIRSVPTNIVSEKETTSQNEKSVASTKSKCMYILYKIQIFLHIYKHFNIPGGAKKS